MAEPQISSSSESEDEQDQPYTQFTNEMDHDTEDRIDDILNHPPSDSDSDTEVEPHSVYNIMKPFHIPGTGSSVGMSGDAAPQSGLLSQGSEFSIIENVTESVESSENQTVETETEETDDKILMEDTDVGPSLTIDLEAQETVNEKHTENNDEQIKVEKGDDDDDADVETKQKKRTPPQPPPKPVFKVVDNRKLIPKSENSQVEKQKGDANESYEHKTDTDNETYMFDKSHTETDSNEECEKEMFSQSLEENCSMSGDEEVEKCFIIKVEETDLTGQIEEAEQNDNEHLIGQTEKVADIITDSMLRDITMKNEELETCFVGMESFVNVSNGFSTPRKQVSEADDEEFSTPKEHMSDAERETPEPKQEPEPLTPDCEPTSASSDRSFVVIGKGTFRDSGRGYKSISSSISESELTKSGEGFPDEDGSQEKGEADESEHIPSFKDRIKLFEEASKEQPVKTVNKTVDTTDVISGSDRISPVSDRSEEVEQRETDSENEYAEEIKQSSDDNEDVDDDRPPVPPKSDAVLESLRSMPYESNTTQEDQRFLEKVSETQERIHTHSGSDSDIHRTEQEHQRMSGMTEGVRDPSTGQGSASMPHSQSNPMFSQNQWGYYQQYPPGYYPGNTPFSMDPEMYQKMMNENPMYLQFLQYQHVMFRQQMFARQSPNVNQNASFAQASDSYRTESPETLQGPDYRSTYGQQSLPTDATQQQMKAEHVQQYQAPPSYSSHAEFVTQGASDSLSKMKEEPVKDGRKELDSTVHKTEEMSAQKTKQQGPPVPKPRKTKAKEHHATPSEKPKVTSEKAKATSEKPKMATERPKPTTKPSGFLKQSKVHPAEQKVYGRSPAGKSKESTSKQTPKIGQFHAEKPERTEKKDQETLLFVKNINPNTSTENLGNFLEGGVGKHAEVKEDTTIIQSRDKTEALVIFTGKPDMSELRKRCSQRPLDDHHVTVCEVPDPTCIAVSSEDEIKSTDTVSLYFEAAKSGGGDLAVEEVLESSDGSCKIIQFKSAEVVKRVCSKGRCHIVDGVKLKVSPYYKCELGEIWDTTLHNIRLPSPVTKPLSKPKLHFLARHCCHELREDLSSKYADMEITDSGLKISCTLTQRTPNCRSIAKLWASDVQGAVDVFMDKLLEKTVEVKNHVWDGVCEFLDKGELDKDTLLIEKQDNKVYLLGMKTNVEDSDNLLSRVMVDLDRQVRRKSETVPIKSPARVRLLQSMGIFEEIEGQFTDLTITPEKFQVCIEGVPEDITKATLDIHEANVDIVSDKVVHGFSDQLVRFVNQDERENKVLQKFQEELNDDDIVGEVEITMKNCEIFVPPGNHCSDVKDKLFDLICEEIVQLEKESMEVLDEQIWDDLNEDLTERYEESIDISVNRRDQFVRIVGLKEFVQTAKDQVNRFFEENTVKAEVIPMDQFSQTFTKKYNMDRVADIQEKLSEHKVTIYIRDKDILVKATKKGLQLAKQQLKVLIDKICHKDHTLKKVGVTEAMGNITMQLNEIETKTRCLIETPFMTETVYSPQQHGDMGATGGATWRDLDDKDGMPQSSSSVDEAPGFTAKNGVKVLLVKGEIGKQEASVIVCTTSPTLNLKSGAAGKSLLKEGGDSLQDECKGIIAKKEAIKPGEIVAIGGGSIECKNIYLTVLPAWKDDSSSLQVLEDIMRDCLQKASKDSCFSILFCALGTGGLRYPAEEVAAVMYSKVIEFDSANPDTMLKEVKFVLYPKDTTSIQAFEKEERLLRFGGEKITYDIKHKNTTVTLVTEQLATQKVDCILCTTNKDMNLKASGACGALLAAGGQSLTDDCKNNYGNQLQEGMVADIGAGKLKCKSLYLTVLPPYTPEAESTLKDVVKTTLGLAQAKKYKSLACIALGTGYLKYPQAVAAKCMYTAVEDFVAANPTTCLQTIKFVMHAKDTKTIEAFRAYVRTCKSKVSAPRKGRTLDHVGQPGRKTETNRDYNAFSDGCQIRNITLKVMTGDILEQRTDGIVNSVNEDFKFYGGVATALKKRCPGLENESQRKVPNLRQNGVTTTHKDKHGGNLKSDYIVHIAFQKSLDKWKSKLKKCLETAEKKKMKSLSIPVLGTGSGQHTFKPEDITACLFDAVDEFTADQKQQGRLRELRFVIFHKQKFMLEPVIKSLHLKTQDAVTALQQKSSGMMAKIKGWFATSKDISQPTEKPSKKGAEISTISLKIYSDDMRNIDICIAEVEQAVENQYMKYTLSDYKELIKELKQEEMDKLEESGGVVDMKIDQTAGIIKIEGPRKFVLDAQTNLHRCLKHFERTRQQMEEAETLYQLIQWHYEEVTDFGIDLISYTKLTNLRIETAYKNKESFLELYDKQSKITYVVDFLSLEEYEKDTKANPTKVVRKDILKSAKAKLPDDWTAMKDDENIRIENIASSSPVYQQIERQFVTEVTTGQYNNRISSMKNVKVTKIDRIQNKALYQQYMAKKELMMKQTPNPPAQFPIERKVWHGTSHASVSSIQVHGFNRSYAGDKNGDPWYGNGVYFAGCASYSARSWLSGANATGDGTTKGYIFLVRALTGEFCKGTKGMRYLPPKNPQNPTVLYDCAVDDPAKPMEFVIFHDAQAYPEYLITFVS